MWKIVRKDPTQLNNDAPASQQKQLQKARRRVLAQAGLAVMTVLLTVVIVFGMTAAWYTNVVQTGGLIFQVEEMGLNVNAVIGASNFTAKPGDSGIIPLTATNQSTTMVNITVSASKNTLDKEMQKRLYFYVERQQTVNQETAERTYLTDGSGYTYSLFANDQLELTELYHNDAQLKWCWVYDVLGYYVLGNVSGSTIAVQEYLRPIEYDYDDATFDTDGMLLTVDGKTTREAFLQQLSETDGFANPIQTANDVGGYYPVEVNDSGYGVYVYLCSRDEVEANTDFDTELGYAAMRGQPQSYEVKLTVNASPATQKTIAVTNSAQLVQYLTDTGSQWDTVALGNAGIVLDQTVTIPEGHHVTLDLNGQTLQTTADTAFTVENGGSMTVINGTMTGNGGRAAVVRGAELTMKQVTMSGYGIALRVEDYDSDALDSVVRLNGCTVDADTCALFTCGNGFDSEQKTTVIIENSSLFSENQTIAGNGTATGNPRYGTDIQIINSQVKSIETKNSAAIFHPQKDSTLNIYKSEIRGYTGIVLKGGTATVCDSTVTGVGDDPVAPGFTSSGFTNTAAAISVETNYDYAISLTVDEASILESYYAEAVAVYQESSPYLTMDIQTANVTNRSRVQIVENSDVLVAQLTGGSDAKLNADITLATAVTIPADADVVLDLNGKTLTTSAESAITVPEGGSLTVVNGTMEGTGRAIVSQGGEVMLDGVTISGYSTALRIEDHTAAGGDSVAYITNCVINTTGYGVLVYGNGDTSEETTKLVIEDSELYSDLVVLSGSGNDVQHGTEIEIIRCELISNAENKGAAIYHPQKDSTLTICDSIISGFTGIAIKGGAMTIENSQVTGAGAEPAEPAHASSGFTDTAAAISVETSYSQPITVTVDASSTLESYYTNAVIIYEENTAYVTADIQTTDVRNQTKSAS